MLVSIIDTINHTAQQMNIHFKDLRIHLQVKRKHHISTGYKVQHHHKTSKYKFNFKMLSIAVQHRKHMKLDSKDLLGHQPTN